MSLNPRSASTVTPSTSGATRAWAGRLVRSPGEKRRQTRERMRRLRQRREQMCQTAGDTAVSSDEDAPRSRIELAPRLEAPTAAEQGSSSESTFACCDTLVSKLKHFFLVSTTSLRQDLGAMEEDVSGPPSEMSSSETHICDTSFTMISEEDASAGSEPEGPQTEDEEQEIIEEENDRLPGNEQQGVTTLLLDQEGIVGEVGAFLRALAGKHGVSKSALNAIYEFFILQKHEDIHSIDIVEKCI